MHSWTPVEHSSDVAGRKGRGHHAYMLNSNFWTTATAIELLMLMNRSFVLEKANKKAYYRPLKKILYVRLNLKLPFETENNNNFS